MGHINGNDDWIFYRNQSDVVSLYCVNFDGKLKHKLIEKTISYDEQYISIFDLNNIGDYIPTFGFSDRRLIESRIYKIPFKDPGVELIYTFNKINF